MGRYEPSPPISFRAPQLNHCFAPNDFSFFLMGQARSLFDYFRPFLNSMTNRLSTKFDNKKDRWWCAVWDLNPDRKMEGADESTEIMRPPIFLLLRSVLYVGSGTRSWCGRWTGTSRSSTAASANSAALCQKVWRRLIKSRNFKAREFESRSTENFKQWADPGLFSFIFSLPNQSLQFYNKSMWKMSIQYTGPGFELTTFWGQVSSLNH